MKSEEENMPNPGKKVPLPKPDPDNIKVLTSHLPKAPILPWNNFDSPWLDENKDDVTDVDDSEVEVDVSETESQKKEDPDDSVITEDVQSNSSSWNQCSSDEIEEQPQNQLVESTESGVDDDVDDAQESVDSEGWFDDEF